MIIVVEKGFLTIPVSVRRHGLERCGIPRGGPMDICRAVLANRLVGNEDVAGILEMTMLPPKICFTVRRTFAVVGEIGNMCLLRAGYPIPVPIGAAVEALPGDELQMGPVCAGLRAYLAIAGGIQQPNPRSYPLGNGAKLSLGEAGSQVRSHTLCLPRILSERRILLRVTPGVQGDFFDRAGYSAFFGTVFHCTSQCDRMGIRLSGAAVPFAQGRDSNILSEGMMPGDIQITSAGQPILMAADCQTVGGYAKIAHVIQADLPAVAQLRPGDPIRFRMVSVHEAHAAWRKLWAELDEAMSPQ